MGIVEQDEVSFEGWNRTASEERQMILSDESTVAVAHQLRCRIGHEVKAYRSSCISCQATVALARLRRIGCELSRSRSRFNSRRSASETWELISRNPPLHNRPVPSSGPLWGTDHETGRESFRSRNGWFAEAEAEAAAKGGRVSNTKEEARCCLESDEAG